MAAITLFDLQDVPVKAVNVAAAQAASGDRLSAHLRQLFILINGRYSVAQLLSLGVQGVSRTSFDELFALGLITKPGVAPVHAAVAATEPRHPAPAKASQPAKPAAVDLSEVRFAIIDILLDHSTRDFALRPWVTRAEQSASIGQLQALVEEFGQSALARKHVEAVHALRQAIS